MGETIVGRRAELDAIDAFLERARGGASALLVEGEAGIGKTRLWQEGVERARARGIRALVSRPGGGDVRLAFAGLGDLLSAAWEGLVTELPPPQRRALAGALLLEDVDAPVEERAVGAAVLAALRALAAESPVLVAIDDLQWLDAPSRRALEHAFRRLDGEPASLLATVRIAQDESDPEELRRALGDERLTRVRLGPMSVGALYELVRVRLGMPLSRPALLRLHDVSGGRPFFALELARALAESDAESTGAEPLPVPRELRELLRARLARLTSEADAVLLLAAALSRPTLTTLETAVTGAAPAIREARDAGIVELDGDSVRFAHPLLASTRYSLASPAERRDAHGQLARAATDPEERARHLALGASGPDEVVAAALEAAAERAERRGALVSSAQLAEQGVALTPPRRRSALHRRRLAAARLAAAAGATARAESILDDALAVARGGSERAQVLRALGDLRFETQDTRVALDLYRAAAAEAGDDLALRASLAIRLSAAAGFWGGGFEVAHAFAREAVELAETVGDARLLADALCELGRRELMLGLRMPHDVFRRAERLESTGGPPRVMGAPAIYAGVLAAIGELDEARARLEPVCDLGRETGDVAVSHTLLQLAAVERDAGNWDRALALVREAHDLAEQSGHDVVDAGSVFALAELEALRGDIPAGRTRALEALELTERTGRLSGGPRAVLGLIELSVERYEEAYAFLAPAIERYRVRGARMLGSQVPDGAEALAALGRPDEARALLEPFEENVRRLGVAWAVAAAARARGLIEAAENLERAEAALSEAVVVGEDVPMPLELGRSLLALGTVQRRLRRRAAARATLGRALDVFEQLGAPVWAERARAELGRIGGRSAPRGALSATEARIAALVRTGRTNREIAAALHLSPHTVEWNLSRMYRKLGVRSRTELAAHTTRD